ncbi:MAG: ribosome recycling factor [Gammaproteobacteria bacterium]|nr:ribosome recycling factor [Gammaproteobacteria bacterium]
MLTELKQDAEQRMHKAVEALRHELSKLRTGRAHPSLLEQIKVDYYGTDTPLNRVATISASDARTLSITPWEKKLVATIEKAILNSGLGLNPTTAGEIIRVPMPALTEERRRELIKVVRQEGEAAKVSIRNVRRDVLADIKELLKEKEITEDEDRRAQEEVQKITDKNIADVDKVLAAKEKDMLEI